MYSKRKYVFNHLVGNIFFFSRPVKLHLVATIMDELHVFKDVEQFRVHFLQYRVNVWVGNV